MGVRYVPTELLRRVELDTAAACSSWATKLRDQSSHHEEARRARLRHFVAELTASLRRTSDILDGLDQREVADQLGREEP